MRTAAVVLLLTCALLEARVQAQDGRVYAGGSVLMVSTNAPPPDPDGSGYLRPNFHGSLGWPVIGLGVQGGVFLSRHWDVRGQFALRRPSSGQITEDEQSGHFETRRLSSRYESSERLLSVLAGRRFSVGSNVDLHPVGGFNVSFSTQRLSDRHGTYSYGSGSYPIDGPDISVQTTSYGAGSGADVVVGTSAPIAFVGGVRFLWLHRTMKQSYYDRSVPPMGSYVLQIAAGVRWRQAR